ncbi:unnamed protein product [Cyclocybe aegerita]|nr:unnamed protein product [Cyclocybe aegerita]
MNIFYVFDECADIADKEGASQIRDVVMDDLHRPEKTCPGGEILPGEMVKYVLLLCPEIPETYYNTKSFGFAPQSSSPQPHIVCATLSRISMPTQQQWFNVKRTIGPNVFLARSATVLPYAETHTFYHPRMIALREQAPFLDINSYPMKVRGLVQGSINWLEGYAAGVQAAFLDNIANLPSCAKEVESRVNIYVNELAQWARGNDDWTFESGRYFGDRGPENQSDIPTSSNR